MSLAVYFDKQCVDATLNNVKLALQKLAEPQNFLTFELSGALVTAAQQGMGPLASFAGDYVVNNADSLAVGLVALSGEDNALREALNAVYKYISVAFLANNNFVFFLLKGVARTAIERIDAKQSTLVKLQTLVTALHNTLLVLSKGDPVYDEYLKDLRSAIADLQSAERRVRNVKSTLQARGVYLSKPYSEAQALVLAAQHKIRPSTGGNPFTTPFYEPGKTNNTRSLAGAARGTYMAGTELLATAGVPVRGEQIDNILAIPQISREIIKTMKDYSSVVLAINGMLTSYMAGTSLLTTLIQDKVKQYALNHLDGIITSIKKTHSDMTENLKGRPNPVKATALAFKWTADVSLIISMMKVLPAQSLEKLSIANEDMNFFNGTVSELQKLDSISNGKASLSATDAKESTAQFESQVLTLLLQANGAAATAKVTAATLSLAKAILARIELTLERDKKIRGILQSFVDRKFAGEEEFERVMSSVRDVMTKAGLDRALDAMNTGDFKKFFKLNAKTATYVGAALESIALLKDCFPTEEERQELTKVQRKLERDMDLLSLKLSFDFDLAIFKNLDLCLRAAGLTSQFNAKEFVCGLADSAGIGKIFSALNDVVSF